MARRRHIPEHDPLLTPVELAALLQVSKRTIDDWRGDGTGPKYVRLGSSPRSRIRYRRSEVDAWLEANPR